MSVTGKKLSKTVRKLGDTTASSEVSLHAPGSVSANNYPEERPVDLKTPLMDYYLWFVMYPLLIEVACHFQ